MINLSQLEDGFWDSCNQLDVKLKCPKGHKFSSVIAYGGVVAQEEREMSPEFMHVWNNEVTCPICKNNENLTVELAYWEYPVGCPNHATFDNDSECEVLNKKEISDKIGLEIK